MSSVAKSRVAPLRRVREVASMMIGLGGEEESSDADEDDEGDG
jgi:hypothetical protein